MAATAELLARVAALEEQDRVEQGLTDQLLHRLGGISLYHREEGGGGSESSDGGRSTDTSNTTTTAAPLPEPYVQSSKMIRVENAADVTSDDVVSGEEFAQLLQILSSERNSEARLGLLEQSLADP
jgi:BMFP domain-containing protein YqiC